jgi:hypothetical protein
MTELVTERLELRRWRQIASTASGA